MAIEAGRRMIARGERPCYHVLTATTPEAVEVTILEIPLIHVFVPERRRAWDGARGLLARELDVPADSFDVSV
jgi:hypothetical protein